MNTSTSASPSELPQLQSSPKRRMFIGQKPQAKGFSLKKNGLQLALGAVALGLLLTYWHFAEQAKEPNLPKLGAGALARTGQKTEGDSNADVTLPIAEGSVLPQEGQDDLVPSTLNHALAQLLATTESKAKLEAHLAESDEKREAMIVEVLMLKTKNAELERRLAALEAASKKTRTVGQTQQTQKGRGGSDSVAQSESQNFPLHFWGRRGEGIVVSARAFPEKQYLVMPGGRMPNGTTFIGYDASADLIRTDYGDYPVQALQAGQAN